MFHLITDHRNATMIRWALDTIRSGDAESVKAIWMDDIEWHAIGLAEPIRTKAELFAFLAEDDGVEEAWTTHDIIGNDQHVVALTTVSVTAGGETREFHTAIVYDIREGTVYARWELSDDTQGLAEMRARSN